MGRLLQDFRPIIPWLDLWRRGGEAASSHSPRQMVSEDTSTTEMVSFAYCAQSGGRAWTGREIRCSQNCPKKKRRRGDGFSRYCLRWMLNCLRLRHSWHDRGVPGERRKLRTKREERCPNIALLSNYGEKEIKTGSRETRSIVDLFEGQ